MENPEEVLHSLEEFSKTKPKDIPRELEEYLCFVAKTGDPVYQWPAIKSLFREKLINVITEFYEACPSVEIPPCPNVDIFNYDVMKSFILEKLDTFAAAPFTLQRICELLTTPRKEYNRIDKYMRALEKNILVVSTTEPGGRRSTENGEGVMNGLESEHLPETSNSSNDINVEEMDDTPSWPRLLQSETSSTAAAAAYPPNEAATIDESSAVVQETVVTTASPKLPTETPCSSSQDSVITCTNAEETYVSIEAVPSSNTCSKTDDEEAEQPQPTQLSEDDVSVTITSIPEGVLKRRNSIEPVASSDDAEETVAVSTNVDNDNSFVKTTDEPIEQLHNTEIKEQEEEILSSSEEIIKDADSSSSNEDILESSEEKIPDTSSLFQTEVAAMKSYWEKFNATPVATAECEQEEQIGNVSEKASHEEEETVVKTKEEEEETESAVDTTKCSNDTESNDEITSSNKIEEVVDSSLLLNSAEAEAKVDPIEENQNEAISKLPIKEDEETSEISESVQQPVEVQLVSEEDDNKIEAMETDSTMDVDETSNNSSNNDKEAGDEIIVKAEATSDSLL